MKRHDFYRILVATDGSRPADAAIAMVANLARASEATVKVVHVWNLEVHHRHGAWDVETRSEARTLIDEALVRLQAAGVQAEGEILRADGNHIVAGLAEAAREFDADLVVVGSRGLSDWQALLKHSVSHQLLTTIDAPTLIVRGERSITSTAPLRVLLAVAGGDDVVRGVRAAAAAAFAPGSRVLVVHVAQTFVGMQGDAYIEPTDEISETMTRTTELLKDAGIDTEAVVAHAGPVADVIAEIGAGWRADVIVTGSRRAGDVGSILLGSVTHRLLRASQTPVLVAERPLA